MDFGCSDEASFKEERLWLEFPQVKPSRSEIRFGRKPIWDVKNKSRCWQILKARGADSAIWVWKKVTFGGLAELDSNPLLPQVLQDIESPSLVFVHSAVACVKNGIESLIQGGIMVKIWLF